MVIELYPKQPLHEEPEPIALNFDNVIWFSPYWANTKEATEFYLSNNEKMVVHVSYESVKALVGMPFNVTVEMEA